MKVLFDLNIVLDVILERPEWLDKSKSALQAALDDRVEGYICATSVTNCFYIARRLVGTDAARNAIDLILRSLLIAPVDAETLRIALDLRGADFEDDVQIAAASVGQLDRIVTRDKEGFRSSTVKVLTPEMLTQELNP